MLVEAGDEQIQQYIQRTSLFWVFSLKVQVSLFTNKEDEMFNLILKKYPNLIQYENIHQQMKYFKNFCGFKVQDQLIITKVFLLI